jgi:hypothetical protein
VAEHLASGQMLHSHHKPRLAPLYICKFSLDAARLGYEVQTVMTLRMLKLARGGKAAETEARRDLQVAVEIPPYAVACRQQEQTRPLQASGIDVRRVADRHIFIAVLSEEIVGYLFRRSGCCRRWSCLQDPSSLPSLRKKRTLTPSWKTA